MSRTRAGTRSLNATGAVDKIAEQTEAAKGFGTYLFDTVFAGEVRQNLETSLLLAEKDDRGLRLRLRLDADRDLLDLPWEYLYDDGRGQFLALSERTPVVRYPTASQPPRQIEVKLPLKILVAISTAAPDGLPALDVDTEWVKLSEDALGDARRQGIVALHRVGGSLTEIKDAFDRIPYDVFHYVGHSGFDAATRESVLWLESDGGPVERSGNDLAQILGPQQGLGLAVFNSCEGARADATDPFAGIAQSLLRKRVPAAVAMQFEIRDDAAIVFARSFYAALAEGQPVDGAVSRARRAMFSAAKDVEWGTPVLFLRSEEGQIFIARELTAEEGGRLGDLARWYKEGSGHFAAERWDEATELFQRIVDVRPDYLDAGSLLTSASGRAQPDQMDKETLREDSGPHPVPPVAIFVALLILVIIIIVVVQGFL